MAAVLNRSFDLSGEIMYSIKDISNIAELALQQVTRKKTPSNRTMTPLAFSFLYFWQG
ncbi:hypothetical protein [Alteribacillus bidgolensis]|uniref:Uncharacterized protein n=1 Tax=Alteribacillus bidgolensis TaxID=930129 RepID=A0A1G8JJI7_9BACI|nr:hypothetical protein [Alteribacillus bidgolensis]SDI31316.1 hypothetical protein SAMN05216352_106220 [Alteribacillus bidgolensis]